MFSDQFGTQFMKRPTITLFITLVLQCDSRLLKIAFYLELQYWTGCFSQGRKIGANVKMTSMVTNHIETSEWHTTITPPNVHRLWSELTMDALGSLIVGSIPFAPYWGICLLTLRALPRVKGHSQIAEQLTKQIFNSICLGFVGPQLLSSSASVHHNQIQLFKVNMILHY